MEEQSKKEIQVSKSTVDSLVFFTFGATLDEEYLLYAVIKKAFFDATNQGAFNTLVGKVDDHIKADAKKDAIMALYEEIQKYNTPKGEKFNAWHKSVCEKVRSPYKKEMEDEFSHGNAQKLVNMTIKYLYLLSGIADHYEINSSIKEILTAIKADSKYLHVPIDSYIIDAIWNQSDDDAKKKLPGKTDEERRKNRNSLNTQREYKRPSDNLLGWSRWDENNYKNAQSAISMIIKKQSEPLEWESKSWITVAQKRRGSDKICDELKIIYKY